MNESETPNLLDSQDAKQFESWLGLKKDALTWQGRFEKDFTEFWGIFFKDGLPLNEYFKRFNYALIHVKRGPLSSWFSWLQSSLVCYLFVFKEMSIKDISEISNISYDDISLMVRDFYMAHYPELDDDFSELLQVANVLSANTSRTSKSLQEDLDLDEREKIENSPSLLQSMEITLYEEWKDLFKKMKKDFHDQSIDYEKVKTKLSLKGQLYIVRDVVIFVVLITGFLVATKKLNKVWEQSLIDKISVYDPQFKWLDKTLSFQEREESVDKDFGLDKTEIDKVENSENKFDNINFSDDVRYETESEVSLTSWDSLPKDFDTANLEQSGYEELKNQGYRDSRYGSTKVYRVMMRSVDTKSAREKLTKLLTKYEVTRVDNVEPGKQVPGGIYYNLYVPRKYLKEFMSQVMKVDESILYESRTRTKRNPPGMNKVFIWIKNI